MLPWITVPVGSVLLFFALRDVVLTLMTATGRGSISRRFMGLAWHASRPVVRRWPRHREVAGPLTFFGVIGIWGLMIIAGWALIYWPFLPDEFLIDSSLDFANGTVDNVVLSLYFSTVVLATLGFGDVVPTNNWLRLLVPIEGLIGFGLLTAGVSWFISVFPALARRRRLAHQISLIREAEESMENAWEPEAVVMVMDSISMQLIIIRSDQLQQPVIYYFRDANPAAELVSNLRYLLDMADRAQDRLGDAGSPMYLQQHMLREATADYIETSASQFLDVERGDLDQMLEALTQDRV